MLNLFAGSFLVCHKRLQTNTRKKKNYIYSNSFIGIRARTTSESLSRCCSIDLCDRRVDVNRLHSHITRSTDRGVASIGTNHEQCSAATLSPAANVNRLEFVTFHLWRRTPSLRICAIHTTRAPLHHCHGRKLRSFDVIAVNAWVGEHGSLFCDRNFAIETTMAWYYWCK